MSDLCSATCQFSVENIETAIIADVLFRENKMSDWLIDDTSPVDIARIESSLRKPPPMRGSKPPPIGVRINDLVVSKTKKWFGGADIRLDTLVCHGIIEGDAPNCYQASTFSFSGIKDGDRLPIEHPGQSIFYGHPKQFLSMAILASRDRKDSDDLSSLLKSNIKSAALQPAISALAATAGYVTPEAAVVVGAVEAAKTVSEIAYNFLKSYTGSSIGIYRTTWYQADRFGLGRQPATGSFKQQDFSFWYEILLDKNKPN